jgi:thiol-disulfide isomerase/thioredoxin
MILSQTLRVTVIFCVAIFGLSGFASAQALKPFTIKGTLPATSSGYIYLNYLHDNKQWLTDSCKLNNGFFSITGNLASPQISTLSYKKSRVSVFIEPVIISVVSASDDLQSAKITGSISQRENEILIARLNRVERRWKVTLDTMQRISKRNFKQFSEMREWVYAPYFADIAEVNTVFYNQYPTSYATACSIAYDTRDIGTDTLKMYYNRFTEKMKQGLYGNLIYEQLEKRKTAAVGKSAPVFARTDINGAKLDLTSFRGKYVLLDFWASWCVPCRKGNPHLKELYTTYKDKNFEIIGIASDDNTTSAWRKAVTTDGLPWLHILDGLEENKLGKIYSVDYLPTKVLIDKNGKIIGRYGEESDELDKKLKSLL